MPLYEYTCESCGHRFELLQPMGRGADGVICPSCGAERARRELSTFASSVAGGKATAAPAGACGGGSGFT